MMMGICSAYRPHRGRFTSRFHHLRRTNFLSAFALTGMIVFTIWQYCVISCAAVNGRTLPVAVRLDTTRSNQSNSNRSSLWLSAARVGQRPKLLSVVRSKRSSNEIEPPKSGVFHKLLNYLSRKLHLTYPDRKYATCTFVDNVVEHTTTKRIRGVVSVRQNNANSRVQITGTVRGLTPGRHGFHITEFGDVSDYCFGVGRHYNPFNTTHGSPHDQVRHVGDLGNILADDAGIAQVKISDKIISLFGRHSIVGRAVVIHAQKDDLGRGGDATSLLNGNPGPHVACCTIGLARDDRVDALDRQSRPDSFGFA